MNIGEKIKFYRKQKKLTQQQLANKSDVALMSIQRYERNERQPNIETLLKISTTLEISVTDLVGSETNLINASKIDIKQRAYDSISNLLSYAVSENKIDSCSLLPGEIKLILEATIDNIAYMTKLLHTIPVEERSKVYESFENQ